MSKGHSHHLIESLPGPALSRNIGLACCESSARTRTRPIDFLSVHSSTNQVDDPFVAEPVPAWTAAQVPDRVLTCFGILYSIEFQAPAPRQGTSHLPGWVFTQVCPTWQGDQAARLEHPEEFTTTERCLATAAVLGLRIQRRSDDSQQPRFCISLRDRSDCLIMSMKSRLVKLV